MKKLDVKPGDILLSQIILEELEKKEGSNIRRFRCECLNCGKIADKYFNHLINAKTGCNCTKVFTKRESKYTPEQKKLFMVWNMMKQRCYNANSKSYPFYGGKGITMSDEWKNSFDSFYRDMGEKPKGMSIDRIDGNKGYSKENCRWADIYTQNNNRSNNVRLPDGTTLAEWCRSNNVSEYYTQILSIYKKGCILDNVLKKVEVWEKNRYLREMRKNYNKNCMRDRKIPRDKYKTL